jgi:Male sterility protein/Phosphopantetheine attachment site
MAEIEHDRLAYVDRRNNVLKLAQGEFVAIAHLEAVFSGAPLVRQIFVYGNSERANLLAVVVPTLYALDTYAGDTAGLKSALSESLQRTAKAGELQSYELPVDFIVETEPFSADNGLLSGVGKLLRPNLKEHYGARLEQMYADIAAAQVDELRVLRATATDQPVIDTLTRTARAVLGAGDLDPDAHFTDLGGDSLSALTFSNLLTGLEAETWSRLADSVDLVVHPAALVNHVLPYTQLFGPNVVGTAELIRLAITTRIKPITYLSTIAVAMTVPPAEFEEDGEVRTVSPVRQIDESYANGYANSKWAGEVLLREAHDLCGLPVAVFRSDMILAHSRYSGQLNVPDMFTRLLFSLLATGIAHRGPSTRSTPRATGRGHITTGCPSTSSPKRSRRWVARAPTGSARMT